MTRLLELRERDTLRIIGLMSGTSADGVDAAVCEFAGAADRRTWELLGWATTPFTPEERARIHAAKDATAGELSALNFWLGERFAEAARAAAAAAGLAIEDCHAIGSHGQTVFHSADSDPANRHTLQLGAAAVIAERTGLPVVSDFRSRDVAAGGHGAPLMPYADATLLGHPDAVRWLLNLGGMANVTVLPLGGGAPVGWDTGPGNALIDAATAYGTGGEHTHDAGGELAASGTVDPRVLDGLMAHPYLTLPPPKSTGRETFGPELAQRVVDGMGRDRLADAVATLTAFTAASVADSLERFARPVGVPADCLISGGGVHNPVLVRELRDRLAPVEVRTTDEEGLPADAKEAVGFALLAYETLRGRPSNCPTVTGARRAVVLGSITI